jgi:hypothetical protein
MLEKERTLNLKRNFNGRSLISRLSFHSLYKESGFGGIMTKLFKLFIVINSLLLASPHLFAHHSIAAEFDAENPIKLVGTVKEVVWMNPHISVFVNVPQDNGNILTYEVQGGAPNSMYRRGARKDDLKPGDPIIVEGARARNEGSLRVGQGDFTTPDGTEVW